MLSSSLMSHVTAQTTPTLHEHSSPDREAWVENVLGFQLYHIYRARCEEQSHQQALALAQRIAEGPNHIDPRLMQPNVELNQFPRAQRPLAQSCRSILRMSQGVSPRAQPRLNALTNTIAYANLSNKSDASSRLFKISVETSFGCFVRPSTRSISTRDLTSKGLVKKRPLHN